MASSDAWSLSSSDFEVITDGYLKGLALKLHAAFKALRVRLTSHMERVPSRAEQLGLIRGKLDIAHQEIYKLVIGHEDFTQSAIQWSLGEITRVLRSCEEEIHSKIFREEPYCQCGKQ